MASYPALEDWFSISIRRNRKSFIIATVGKLLGAAPNRAA
jgi:hypothetical protein